MEDSFENKMSVGNQESLFDLTQKPDTNIEKYDEETANSSEQSYMQFDLFDQNVKVLNKTNKSQKINQYSNKYEDLNNIKEEIEPKNNTSVDLKDLGSHHISRESVYSNVDTEKEDFEVKNGDNFQQPKQTDNENNKNNDDVNQEEVVFGSKTQFFDAIKKDVSPRNQSTKQTQHAEKQNISWQEKPKEEKVSFENNDYRETIGQLFNDSKMTDPYEKNKAKSFKELFPSTQISEENNQKQLNEIDQYVKNNTESNINCDDLSMLNNLYSLQGVGIKNYSPRMNKTDKSVYTDKNKINMYTLWITAFIMLAEILFTYFIIRNTSSVYLTSGRLIYYIGFALALSLALIGTLENIFDRFKLVVIKPDFKKLFTKRLLIFMIISVVIFAVCLALGMNSLADVNYLSYWVVSILCASNIVTYYLIYYLLLKSKKFGS